MKLIYDNTNSTNTISTRVWILGKSRTNYDYRIYIQTKIFQNGEVWETLERYNANVKFDDNGNIKLDKQAKPYKYHSSIKTLNC